MFSILTNLNLLVNVSVLTNIKVESNLPQPKCLRKLLNNDKGFQCLHDDGHVFLVNDLVQGYLLRHVLASESLSMVRSNAGSSSQGNFYLSNLKQGSFNYLYVIALITCLFCIT